MSQALPSALITDNGRRVLLRIRGRFYELSQKKLRTLLGLPPGPAGLGISIDSDRLRFEFSADQRNVEVSVEQLHRRLAKQTASSTSRQARMR
jgi:hypothetical protein